MTNYELKRLNPVLGMIDGLHVAAFNMEESVAAGLVQLALEIRHTLGQLETGTIQPPTNTNPNTFRGFVNYLRSIHEDLNLTSSQREQQIEFACLQRLLVSAYIRCDKQYPEGEGVNTQVRDIITEINKRVTGAEHHWLRYGLVAVNRGQDYRKFLGVVNNIEKDLRLRQKNLNDNDDLRLNREVRACFKAINSIKGNSDPTPAQLFDLLLAFSQKLIALRYVLKKIDSDRSGINKIGAARDKHFVNWVSQSLKALPKAKQRALLQVLDDNHQEILRDEDQDEIYGKELSGFFQQVRKQLSLPKLIQASETTSLLPEQTTDIEAVANPSQGVNIEPWLNKPASQQTNDHQSVESEVRVSVPGYFTTLENGEEAYGMDTYVSLDEVRGVSQAQIAFNLNDRYLDTFVHNTQSLAIYRTPAGVLNTWFENNLKPAARGENGHFQTKRAQLLASMVVSSANGLGYGISSIAGVFNLFDLFNE